MLLAVSLRAEAADPPIFIRHNRATGEAEPYKAPMGAYPFAGLPTCDSSLQGEIAWDTTGLLWRVCDTNVWRFPSPLTTKGDIPVFDGGTSQRLPVGTNGQVVTADSTETLGVKWADAPGASSLPAGLIVLTLSSCPSGFSEVSSLDGKFVLGTLAAHADVGTTGGADTISTVLNHTHVTDVTDPGHNHTQNSHNHTQDAHQHGMAEGTTDGSGTFMDRSNAAAATSAVTDLATATNQAATATNQANTTGVTASTQNPAGGVATIDNRPAFVKVIFCSKD